MLIYMIKQNKNLKKKKKDIDGSWTSILQNRVYETHITFYIYFVTGGRRIKPCFSFMAIQEYVLYADDILQLV